MPLKIIRDDITKVKADAIVNTANPYPRYAAGTDRAVYEAAGANQLLAQRKRIGIISEGQVAVTDAFALPARFIIHTFGRNGKMETAGSLIFCVPVMQTVCRKHMTLDVTVWHFH